MYYIPVIGFYTSICVYNIRFTDVFTQTTVKRVFSSSYNDHELQALSSVVFFVGSSSGRIVRINLIRGKEEFSIQAHENEICSIIPQFSISKVNFSLFKSVFSYGCFVSNYNHFACGKKLLTYYDYWNVFFLNCMTDTMLHCYLIWIIFKIVYNSPILGELINFVNCVLSTQLSISLITNRRF